MAIKIILADGSVKTAYININIKEETTLRPTIDVRDIYSSTLNKKREKALRKNIHTTHALSRTVRMYRELQIAMLRVQYQCSKKYAKALAVDPNPYEKGFVFYCL
jgi:hypothetical protein